VASSDQVTQILPRQIPEPLRDLLPSKLVGAVSALLRDALPRILRFAIAPVVPSAAAAAMGRDLSQVLPDFFRAALRDAIPVILPNAISALLANLIAPVLPHSTPQDLLNGFGDLDVVIPEDLSAAISSRPMDAIADVLSPDIPPDSPLPISEPSFASIS
jgi:hypothetical protein